VKVCRIVSNIESKELAKAQAFYGGFLGLDILMDHGWIKTFGSSETTTLQVSVASEGGSGTPVPDLSVEVDDLPSAPVTKPVHCVLARRCRHTRCGPGCYQCWRMHVRLTPAVRLGSGVV